MRCSLNIFDGWLYGAGNEKLGNIVGKGSKAGAELKSKLLKNIPALGKLMNKVKEFIEVKGYIPSIDKRKIRIRSHEGRYLTHTGLNALLQASGSIVVKRALVIIDKEIKRRGLDAKQIIFYHDESLYCCEESVAYEVAKITEDGFRLAGEYYNLRIPIAGKSAIGKTWGDVH